MVLELGFPRKLGIFQQIGVDDMGAGTRRTGSGLERERETCQGQSPFLFRLVTAGLPFRGQGKKAVLPGLKSGASTPKHRPI